LNLPRSNIPYYQEKHDYRRNIRPGKIQNSRSDIQNK
jgi:hypothetical protein